MFKSLRIRFILFNMIIISAVLFILAFFVFFGSKNDLSAYRFISVIVFSLIIVFIGSFIISKFALTPVKQAWQKQLDFTADASHELRTPLAVIKTNLEIVMDSPDETVKSQMQWLENIEAEQSRMTKLVNDLLVLSRADTNEQIIQKETFMISDALLNIVNSFTPVCNKKGLKLISLMDRNLTYIGDKGQLEQLAVILLDNAVQYTDIGTITFTLKQMDKGIEMMIADTGYGLSDKDKNKVFDRFYRVTNTRQKNPDGSGLGLSIAKLIVNQHHGEIYIDSTMDKGTTVRVFLPNS